MSQDRLPEATVYRAGVSTKVTKPSLLNSVAVRPARTQNRRMRHGAAARWLGLLALTAAVATSMAADIPDSSHSSSKTQRLFRIERSKNDNIVAYDLRLDGDGRPDPKSPVEAYWVIAEDGARYALSAVQKRFAYGFKSELVDPEVVVLRLAADLGREIRVERVRGVFRALIDIGGRRAVLDHIYVKSVERKLLLPSVEFVDLFGFDPDTGDERRERILP